MTFREMSHEDDGLLYTRYSSPSSFHEMSSVCFLIFCTPYVRSSEPRKRQLHFGLGLNCLGDWIGDIHLKGMTSSIIHSDCSRCWQKPIWCHGSSCWSSVSCRNTGSKVMCADFLCYSLMKSVWCRFINCCGETVILIGSFWLYVDSLRMFLQDLIGAMTQLEEDQSLFETKLGNELYGHHHNDLVNTCSTSLTSPLHHWHLWESILNDHYWTTRKVLSGIWRSRGKSNKILLSLNYRKYLTRSYLSLNKSHHLKCNYYLVYFFSF